MRTKSRIRTLFIFMASFLMLSSYCDAQQKIRLTNVTSKKELYLTEGKRVICVLKNGDKIVGTLSKVGEDQITVENQAINLTDITSIGKKNKGSGFGVFVLAGIGGTLIGSSLRPSYDPCPTCQTTPDSDDGSSGKVIGLVGGTTLVGLAIMKAVRNSPKDITTKWHLDIVD